MKLLRPESNFLRADYWFGQVDSRPLSLFRVCFAALLLKNALYHLPVAHRLYSDTGIVPRAPLWPGALEPYHFSLLDYLAADWMVVCFFLLWSGVTLALLLGYHTSWMAPLNLIFILSVQARNPYDLTGANVVMRVLSFWMLFVSLNHHYALEARRTPAASHTTFAFPLRLMQLQVALIYVLTWYVKINSGAWLTGDALHYTFQMQAYLLPLGEWLPSVSPAWVLRVFTWGTLVVEGAFAPLVFLPLAQPFARATGLLLAALLHLGIALTMTIPDFSLVMGISYLLFFEPAWLDWLEQRCPWRLASAPQPLADQPARRHAQLPVPMVKRRWFARAQQLVLTVGLTIAMVAIVWGSFESASNNYTPLLPPMPAVLHTPITALQLSHSWGMFSYETLQRAGWIVIAGQFEQGAARTLYSGEHPPLWGPEVQQRDLDQSVAIYRQTPILRAWGHYYCQLYNGAQTTPVGRLAHLEIHYRYRRTYRPGTAPRPLQDDLLWTHRCY